MSLNEINGVLKVLHDTRRLQSRIMLLTAQLSRHEQSRNAAAFEARPSPATNTTPTTGKSPASLSLAAVLDDVDALLLEQWGERGSTPGSLSHRGGKAGFNHSVQAIAVEEHKDQVLHLRNVVERLRTMYNLPMAAHGKASGDAIPASVIKLSDVDGMELVSLLGLIYSVGRLAEDTLTLRIAAHQSHINDLIKSHKLSEATTSSSSQVAEEIASFNSLPVEEARVLSVPFQSFAGPGAKSLIQHVIVTKSWLTVVDLSHCLLGDRCVGSELLPPLSKLQHLAVLLLEDNALTDVVVPIFLAALPGTKGAGVINEGSDGGALGDAASGAHVMRFPRLRILNLKDNLIDGALLNQVHSVVEHHATRNIAPLHSFARLLDERSLPRSDSVASLTAISSHPLRHLHCEATSMHAAILARSLMCCHLDRGTSEPFKVFSGASFASIVAVAMMLEVPYETLWTFFLKVSVNVFVEYHYSFYAVSATRALRRWWTGGDYYSADAFRQHIIELFGEDIAQSTLQQLHTVTGKHCMLLCRSGSGNAPTRSSSVVAFRSWSTAKAHAQFQDATGVLNESLHVRLVDALVACCASPHMFAPATPHVVGDGAGIAPRVCSPCSDAVVGSMDLVVVELLSSLRGRTALESTLFAPTEPFAAQDLLDPSMHKRVAAKLREQSESRATSSFNSSSAWQDAQGALVLWGDVSLSVSVSFMKRMVRDAATTEAATTVDGDGVQGYKSQSPAFTLKTVFTVKKHASVRKSAVRLDEPYLERTVEVLEDSFRVPIL